MSPSRPSVKRHIRLLLFCEGHDQCILYRCKVQQPEASHVASDRDGIGEPVKVVVAPATQKMHHEAQHVDDVGACAGVTHGYTFQDSKGT